jgi:O-antigen/teichoic acid export membrane protein
MFALLIPIAGLLIFFPDKFLLLFGQDYSQNGAGLLRLLALVPLFRSVVVVYYVSKQIQQRMRIVVCLNVMWTVIVLGASALLIPLMGLMGAGVAFIAAHLFVTLVIGWRVLVIEK